MKDEEIRGYFTALKHDANRTEDRFEAMDRRFDRLEEILEQMARNMATFFETHGIHESTINYHGSMISNHERRIGKLESQIS